MPFDLPNSFLTRIDRLDSDHKALVARINSIAEHEQSSDRDKLLATLAHFMADLAEHFEWEERLLKQENYPQTQSHAMHHTETITMLDQLMCDVEVGNKVDPSVAHICFHELISAVLMRDMEFASWLSARSIPGHKLTQ